MGHFSLKVCKKCNKEKPFTEFYRSKQGHYQARCKECNIELNKEWADTNKKKTTLYARRYREVHKNTAKIKSQQILDNMRKRSKGRDWGPPEFTKQEIEKIITNGKCKITDIPFEFSQEKYWRSPWTPTPDRIDSTKGYTKDNVQWVCYIYNAMKDEFSVKDVEIFLESLFNKYYGNF